MSAVASREYPVVVEFWRSRRWKGRITGQLRFLPDDEGIPSIKLSVLTVPELTGLSPSVDEVLSSPDAKEVWSGTTDDDGEFELTSVEGGTYAFLFDWQNLPKDRDTIVMELALGIDRTPLGPAIVPEITEPSSGTR